MPDPLGDFAYTWPFYLGALLGYLLGSIPFGLLLAKFAGYGDIRAIGSGSIGATNVLRTGNKPLAAATVALDGGKGAAAALVGAMFGPDMAVLAAGGAMLGHLFPVWLKFRGGKGVATALGVLLAVAWPVGLAAILTWLALAAIFRYSSLAGILSIAASPVYAYALADVQRAELALFIALLVAFCHRANIARLVRGEEPKIGRGGDSASTGGG